MDGQMTLEQFYDLLEAHTNKKRDELENMPLSELQKFCVDTFGSPIKITFV